MEKAAGCLLVLFLAGCAGQYTEYPEAKTYPHSTQQKMQAAYHWQVLAANEAKLISSKVPANGSVYLAHSSSKYEDGPTSSGIFNSTYRDLLTSELVNSGVIVSTSEPRATHKLMFNVNTIEHTDRNSLPPKPGASTGVLSFIAALGASARNWNEPALALIPLMAASDLRQYWSDDTSESVTEVVITTRVTSSDQVVSSNSSIYYFNSGDFNHYQSKSRMSVTDVR